MKTKDIASGLIETLSSAKQTALLAYSGNARQRRTAWRKDSRRITEDLVFYHISSHAANPSLVMKPDSENRYSFLRLLCHARRHF